MYIPPEEIKTYIQTYYIAPSFSQKFYRGNIPTKPPAHARLHYHYFYVGNKYFQDKIIPNIKQNAPISKVLGRNI